MVSFSVLNFSRYKFEKFDIVLEIVCALIKRIYKVNFPYRKMVLQIVDFKRSNELFDAMSISMNTYRRPTPY